MTSVPCHCEWGYHNRRCLCFRAGKACSADCPCGCQECNNPFNGVIGLEGFTDCARAHIVKFKLLSDTALQQAYPLACGCEAVMPLRHLMEESVCSACQSVSFYSFCLKEVVQASKIKHCPHCQRCTEQVNSHCVDCRE